MKKTTFFAFVLAMLASLPAFAGSTTTAVEATVLTISQAAGGVSAQAERYTYAASRAQERTNVRAVTGGVVGGAVGALLTRNTGYSERYAAMSGLAAIGTALGNAADRRAERRRQTGGRGDTGGYQVVLRLGNGETRAVFMERLDGSIQPRSRVWLIGDSTIIPAEGAL